MVWSGSAAAVQGGPVMFEVGPVVLVVDPDAAAGTELDQPGNRTLKVKEPTVQPQDEKVMLEAAWLAVPEAGVRTVETIWAGPGAS